MTSGGYQAGLHFQTGHNESSKDTFNNATFIADMQEDKKKVHSDKKKFWKKE